MGRIEDLEARVAQLEKLLNVNQNYIHDVLTLIVKSYLSTAIGVNVYCVGDGDRLLEVYFESAAFINVEDVNAMYNELTFLKFKSSASSDMLSYKFDLDTFKNFLEVNKEKYKEFM